jgi:hypothetical protein
MPVYLPSSMYTVSFLCPASIFTRLAEWEKSRVYSKRMDGRPLYAIHIRHAPTLSRGSCITRVAATNILHRSLLFIRLFSPQSATEEKTCWN